MVDDKNRTTAIHATHRSQIAIDAFHRSFKDLYVRNPNCLHVSQLAEGPAGVVINILLGIAWAPVLIIEQSIGYPAVGLIHPHKVTARGERACLSFFFFWRGGR